MTGNSTTLQYKIRISQTQLESDIIPFCFDTLHLKKDNKEWWKKTDVEISGG